MELCRALARDGPNSGADRAAVPSLDHCHSVLGVSGRVFSDCTPAQTTTTPSKAAGRAFLSAGWGPARGSADRLGSTRVHISSQRLSNRGLGYRQPRCGQLGPSGRPHLSLAERLGDKGFGHRPRLGGHCVVRLTGLPGLVLASLSRAPRPPPYYPAFTFKNARRMVRTPDGWPATALACRRSPVGCCRNPTVTH